MDIVDIDVNIHKYMLVPKHRHIMYVNNISYWLRLDKNIINKKNKQIINNYKKFLNQKNIIIVMECIEYDIFIMPILWCVFKNIVELIEKAFSCQNINMLKLISKHIDKNTLIKYMKKSCENGYINVVKYLHREIGLKKEDFQSDYNYACIFACKNGHINIVKYLHRKIKLTKEDFQSNRNYAYRYACDNGHFDVVKYLHQEIGLTKQDFQSNHNLACQWACDNGHLNIVKYLHREIGLTKKDFQSEGNFACRYACDNGHIDVVKYLHEEIGLTKKDFQSYYNYAYQWACKNKHNEVVEYLRQKIGIQYAIIK